LCLSLLHSEKGNKMPGLHTQSRIKRNLDKTWGREEVRGLVCPLSVLLLLISEKLCKVAVLFSFYKWRSWDSVVKVLCPEHTVLTGSGNRTDPGWFDSRASGFSIVCPGTRDEFELCGACCFRCFPG
jgi:hypothetical protein